MGKREAMAMSAGRWAVQLGGVPLQCSCLENPRDRGAWWAAIYEVAQSWTRLKRLSSSSRARTLSAVLKTPSGEEMELRVRREPGSQKAQ